MQIDPVPPIYPIPETPIVHEVSSLSGVATKMQQQDSGDTPRQPAGSVKTSGDNGTAVTQENKNEVVWNDQPPMDIYRVVNSSGDVIYQYPSAEVVEMAKDITSSLKKEEKGTSSLDERS